MKKNVCMINKYFLLIIFFIYLSPAKVFAQDSKVRPEESDKDKNDWNEFNLKFTTVRLGVALIHEYAAYKQDDKGKAQMDSANIVLKSKFAFRDFRFFANGKLNTKRPIIWKVAAMYDGVNEAWTFRETGLLVGVPELKGNIFIGRSKEGYSLNKVQNGYSTWGNERQVSLDLIPIMTDGIRYYGYLPKPRFFWSIGAFTDLIYERSRFAIWDWNYAGRIGFRPIYKDSVSELLHVGLNFRYAKPDEGMIEVKSKPESNPAPYFLNTGKFASDRSHSLGGEIYYRKGSFMAGTEFNWHHFKSVQAGNPTYFGTDFVLTYLFTGETRPYLSDNSVFFFIEPKKPLFKGGAGAWELVLRYSSFNLNDGLKPGGNFWKITPMINWYVTKNVRMEFLYGYGVLDRFQIKGATQFFQTRFQFQIM